MENSKLLTLIIGLVLFASTSVLHAIPITIGDFSGAETVEDFSGLPLDPDPTSTFTFNDVTYTSSDLWLSQSGGFLFDNITGSSGGTTLNTGEVGDFSLSFSSGINRVGLLLSSGNPLQESWDVSILDSSFSVIESMTVSQLASHDAVFVGFQSTADIFGFRVDNINIDETFYTFIDDIRYEALHSVPEPASLALMSLGLVGLGFSRRKKAA